jgi:hypothetical protein
MRWKLALVAPLRARLCSFPVCSSNDGYDHGTVSDESGALVADATVTVTSAETGGRPGRTELTQRVRSASPELNPGRVQRHRHEAGVREG